MPCRGGSGVRRRGVRLLSFASRVWVRKEGARQDNRSGNSYSYRNIRHRRARERCITSHYSLLNHIYIYYSLILCVILFHRILLCASDLRRKPSCTRMSDSESSGGCESIRCSAPEEKFAFQRPFSLPSGSDALLEINGLRTELGAWPNLKR